MTENLIYGGVFMCLGAYIYNNRKSVLYKGVEYYTHIEEYFKKNIKDDSIIFSFYSLNGDTSYKSILDLHKDKTKYFSIDNLIESGKLRFNYQNYLIEYKINTNYKRFINYNLHLIDQKFITNLLSYRSPLIAVNINIKKNNEIIHKELDITDLFNTFVFPNVVLESNNIFISIINNLINLFEENNEDIEIEWIFIDGNCNVTNTNNFKIIVNENEINVIDQNKAKDQDNNQDNDQDKDQDQNNNQDNDQDNEQDNDQNNNQDNNQDN